MSNTLEVGRRRVGSLVDGDPSTPEVTVTLERTTSGIVLEVPWSDRSSPYLRWFSAGTVYGDDPDRSRYTYSIPTTSIFSDVHGDVTLTGCRAAGMTSNFQAGVGTVSVRAAVMGAAEGVDFRTVHGLRSEVGGLRQWLHLPGVAPHYEVVDNLWHSTTLTLVSSEPLDLLQRSGITLSAVTLGRVSDGEDESSLAAVTSVSTLAEEAQSWPVHLGIHRGLRDLLALSRWVDLPLRISSVSHDSDPLRTMDGTQHGRQWRTVEEGGAIGRAPVAPRAEHLVLFDEIELAGVARWFDLRDEFSRALDPVISTLPLSEASFEVRFAQVATGLEALGYLLLLKNGASRMHARNAHLDERLEAIAGRVAAVCPFDPEPWARRTADLYNGLKHANRALPDTLDVANAWRESVLAVRLWAALELGSDTQALRRRAANDPMAAEFVLA